MVKNVVIFIAIRVKFEVCFNYEIGNLECLGAGCVNYRR